ncbi:MAG: ABC transporter substrate-binding protein [Antarcticimicrobium sp.]|uniref:ABC transporter substrate-binding protein n=1 Tax=Antarcticimicrobium sp. TaxID=2824147 RepID=UPI0026098A10|nr:ABC transporter substrate-binding protein [Antarcticimicrobium sp.]MDF1718350.1 ABC transporter substrate-binding protein [Antarcticimicrobium sp.]
MYTTNWLRPLGAAALTLLLAQAGAAQETLKLGISAPLSGAAATWGLGMEWAAEQAAERVNAEGGVTANGKTYMFDIVSYDNKYSATEGARNAQTMLNRDGIDFIAGTIGTAPVRAMQALTERKGVILFTTAWGKSVKGPEFPFTFTQMNTPFEILVPFYNFIKEQHPDLKTAVLISPNDATGQELEPVAVETWKSLGVEMLASDWYERGTTEFQPIATKIATLNPDLVDFSAAPPTDVGSILKELDVLGWNGVKVMSAGTSVDALTAVAGEAAEGAYLGASADFSGETATEVQKELNAGAREALGEPLNGITISSYDAIMALRAAIEEADSIDPAKVQAVLSSVRFESSYGPSGFGGEATYDYPQQLLIPVIVTRVENGKAVELTRSNPAELEALIND